MPLDDPENWKDGPSFRDFREAGAKSEKSMMEQFMKPTMRNHHSLDTGSVLPSGITIRRSADTELQIEKRHFSSFLHFSRLSLQSRNASVDIAEDKFPQFAKLPIEIRMMIWNAALPGPRVVEIKLLSLKKTQSQWDRERGLGRRNSFAWDDFVSEAAPDERCGFDEDHMPDGRPPLVGVKSQCQNPSILFVNHEAHKAAATYLKKAFSSPASVPETYFDFEKDTLYIRYLKFNLLTRNTAYAPRDQNAINCLRKLNTEDLAKVKKLAVQVHPDSQTHELLEDEIAELLSVFTAVRQMTLVADHHDGCNVRTNDKSPISLIEPIDIYDAFNSYWTSTIPNGVSMFEIPRPKPAKKLISVMITKEKFYAAMQRKNHEMQAAMKEENEAKDFNIFGKKIKIPNVNVMVAITEATKESPELFLTTPILHYVRNHPSGIPGVSQVLTNTTVRPLSPVCGKTARPGMYLQSFKDVVGPLSSSYVEMSWVNYLDQAQATFVEHALKAMNQGQVWWR